VQLVLVAGAAAVGQRLQLELEVGQRPGVEQLAQLVGAQQVVEQVAVERQGRRPPLGQRGVALVHVDGDPAEQQRLGERRGVRRLDLDDPHPPGADVAQHLAQRRQVEHIVEALAGGLQQDREAGVAPGHRQQVGRALALLPQRRAPIGAAAGQQQGPGRRLAEPAGEQRRVGQLAHHHLAHLVGVEGERVDPESHVVERLGQPHGDAVVAPDHLDLDPPALGQAGLDRHAPRGVHRGAVGRQDAHPPVADLVAEALDHDRAVVGHRAGGVALLVEVGDQVGRGPVVEPVPFAQAGRRLGRRHPPQLAHQRPQRPAQLERAARAVAVPERHLARLPGRRGDDHPLVGDLLDAPGRGPEQEGLADPRLVDHLLVELAHPGAVGEEHAEQTPVGDGAGVGDRQPLGARPGPDHPLDPVPHDAGP
jgi:hypothetical protein